MPRGVSRHKGAEKQTILILDTRTMSALAADANDYDLSVGACFNIGGTADRTITGIAGGTEGRVIQLVNTLGYNIFLSNESSSSVAANRILTTMHGGGTFTLPANGSVFLSYNNVVNRWVVLHGTPTAYTPETDANATALFRSIPGNRSGGMMAAGNFLRLLGTSQGFLKPKFATKTSGDTATQAFGVVAGCQVSFTLPVAGDVIVAVSASAFSSFQVINALQIGVRFDADTPLILGSCSLTNGAGADFVGDEHLIGVWGKNLTAGAHTADLCWGDSVGNYTMYSNATHPAVIAVFYPG